MSFRNAITNEELKKRFDNPFQLVNHAITIAEKMFSHGEDLESNQTERILEIILNNEELEEDEEELIEQ